MSMLASSVGSEWTHEDRPSPPVDDAQAPALLHTERGMPHDRSPQAHHITIIHRYITRLKYLHRYDRGEHMGESRLRCSHV